METPIARPGLLFVFAFALYIPVGMIERLGEERYCAEARCSPAIQPKVIAGPRVMPGPG
jgi:hypothetical protein